METYLDKGRRAIEALMERGSIKTMDINQMTHNETLTAVGYIAAESESWEKAANEIAITAGKEKAVLVQKNKALVTGLGITIAANCILLAALTIDIARK